MSLFISWRKTFDSQRKSPQKINQLSPNSSWVSLPPTQSKKLFKCITCPHQINQTPVRSAQRGPRAVHSRRRNKFFRLTQCWVEGGWGTAVKLFHQSCISWWQMSYSGLRAAARVKRSHSSRYSVELFLFLNVKRAPRQQLLFSEQRGFAAQWLTSCAVRGTSSWQLMHTFGRPHQSVTAPRWVEGCYYCKQQPCCCCWLPEACRDLSKTPDLCHFIRDIIFKSKTGSHLVNESKELFFPPNLMNY